MAKQQLSLKQLAIDKDNTAIVVAVGLAAFIIVFSLVASKALLEQRAYQAKVIGKKEVALRQLKSNATEVEKLKTAYQSFAEADQNVLGGAAAGGGDKDGENPRLILDALPSKYDFPALATSLEKVFKQYNIQTITGVDDEVAQAAVASTGSPQPLEIPFSISMNGSAQSSKEILQLYERSIRPIQINKLTLTGEASEIKITAEAKTYFQPQKKFDIKTEKVK